MPEAELISAAELARRAGVTPTSIYRAVRLKLKPALVDRRINAEHPLVKSYIALHVSRPDFVKGTRGRPSYREALPTGYNPLHRTTLPRDTNGNGTEPAISEDVLAQASASAARSRVRPGEVLPIHVNSVGEAGRQYADSVLYDLQSQTAGLLPADLDDLGKLTLRELIDRCGSFEACLTAVKSLKAHAEYIKIDVEAKRKRGTLIERAAVERTVFPYIDLTQKRALEEVPKAVTEQIIARVLSGGDDLSIDVQKLIHDALASVYRDCKTVTVKALGAFDE